MEAVTAKSAIRFLVYVFILLHRYMNKYTLIGLTPNDGSVSRQWVCHVGYGRGNYAKIYVFYSTSGFFHQVQFMLLYLLMLETNLLFCWRKIVCLL